MNSETSRNSSDEDAVARRRQQTDSASKKMGQLLLQGWAMLAEECPKCTIPLMRRPKSGGGIDPRKDCVICESVYTMTTDSSGREQLVSNVVADTPQLPQTSKYSQQSVLNPSILIPKVAPVTEKLHAEKALESTLHVLSEEILSLSQGRLDHAAIGAAADAIAKTAHALSEVRQLKL